LAIEEIHPQWVVVNDQIHRVSDFSHLPPPDRPKAFCPICMNPVILKLGSERVHHYAHQPDVICATTQPETALHLNTKFYIYRQLLSGTRLYLKQQCSNGCGKSRNIPWVRDWVRVEIESNIGPFRPDILIVASGGTNKAIEIKVTHPIESEKEAFFNEQKIGCLEVGASESIYDGENAWTIDQPLPFAVCKPPLPKWTCYHCQAELKQEEKARLKEQKYEEFRKHNYKEILYSKMVDIYYPSGRKYRETYYLKKAVRDDKPLGISIETRKGKEVSRLYGEITEALIEEAFQTTKSEVDRFCNKNRTIVDDHKWLPWVHGKKYFAFDIERYPYRYEWNVMVKKWAEREQQKIESENAHSKERHVTPQDTITITMPEGVCIHCGQTTTDYWSFDGATGKCKCRRCYREGKF